MRNAPIFDKDQLRSKLFEWFSSEYREIDSNSYIDAQMKADFEKSGPLSFFATDLFNRTVSEILLHIDGSVAITLINDQVIQKEATA